MSSGEAPPTVKEFRDNRTSWKFLERHLEKLQNDVPDIAMTHAIRADILQTRVLIEILKELQFRNDRASF